MNSARVRIILLCLTLITTGPAAYCVPHKDGKNPGPRENVRRITETYYVNGKKTIKMVPSASGKVFEGWIMKKILLVDDDEVLAETCKRLLESEGYCPVITANAQKALQVLDDTFSLVISDLDLGDISRDGTWLVQQINKRFDKLPLVMMSGFFPEAIKNNAANCGVRCFLDKPFNMEEFLFAIAVALEKRS